MQNPLQLTGPGFQLAVTSEAHAFRENLLDDLNCIRTVDCEASSEIALQAVKLAASFRNALEKSRKDVKSEPVRIGKEIDSKAKAFGDPVLNEENRVTGLIGAFAARQIMAQRAAEAAARAEEQAAIAAQQAAIEKLDSAKTAAQVRIAAQELKAATVRAVPAVVEAITPVGAKIALDYEITDIVLLASKHPKLVKLEEKRREILEEITLQQCRGLKPYLAGVNIFEVVTVNKR